MNDTLTIPPTAGGELDPTSVFYVDPETGERFDIEVPEQPTGLADKGLAEWVLEKCLGYASELLSAGAHEAKANEEIETLIRGALEDLERTPRMIELRSRQASSARIVKRSRTSLDFFREKYGDVLAEVAKAETDGKKSRTWATPFGSVSLRHTSERLGVRPGKEREAAELLLSYGETEAVKMSPLVSKMSADTVAAIYQDIAAKAGDSLPFEMVPASDAATVTVAGVKL